MAEMLIALALVGVIASFTIRKVLIAQQNQKFNAIAKEAMAMIGESYMAYQMTNTLSATTKAVDLFNYMNYVKVDTTSTLDDNASSSTYQCGGSWGGGVDMCLRLHNGALLFSNTMIQFNGMTNQHAVYFYLDPDGQATPLGQGKSLLIWLYFNGRITTGSYILSNTLNNTSNSPYSPSSQWADPVWFVN